jgi:hypothetical protein
VPQETVDANGNLIGYQLDDLTEAPISQSSPNSGAMQSQGLVMNIGGLEFAVDTTSNGFPVTSDNGVFMEIYYDGPNCTGNAYMEGPLFSSGSNNPLVISTAQGSGCNMCSLQTGFIFDSTIYYPQPPYSNVYVQSAIANPTFANGTVTGSCVNYSPDNPPTIIFGGIMSATDFPNFTPPFTNQPIP